jgi:serine/threonine protein kinase
VPAPPIVSRKNSIWTMAMNDTEREIAQVLASALLADQRRRWQAGDRPLVEEYLAAHPTLAADADSVLDLIYQEIFLREQHGESATLDEYVKRFPQWQGDIQVQFEVHLAIQPDPDEAPLAAAPPAGYELGDEIGRGAMGIVYRARDVRQDRVVAVKLLRPEHFHNRSAVKRFLAEARAVVRLQHRHIVAVHEVGESAVSPYLAMDLIDGPSLEAVLRSGPMPIVQAIATLLPVAGAVDYAHRRGVIHRDLKPSNILLDSERGPVVVDFGMAKVEREGTKSLSSWTQPGAIVGTPAFMPPEQTGVENPEIGPPSDVYSLGAILYMMLTGRPPYAEASALHTIRRVRAAEPPPPVHQFRPDVPERLEQICMRCLEKPLEKRFRTALALADALAAIQADDGSSTIDQPELPFLLDEGTGQRLHLTERRTLLGRAADCNICIKEPKISRHHCRLVVDVGEAEVEDLGSSWGTFVNGQRVQRASLSDGDRIELGGMSFLFRRPD